LNNLGNDLGLGRPELELDRAFALFILDPDVSIKEIGKGIKNLL